MASSSIISKRSRAQTTVVSLLAATAFWVLTALNKDNYSLRIEYPVRFIFNDTLYVATSALPRNVSVNVSGRGWRILQASWFKFNVQPLVYEIKNPLASRYLNTASLESALSEQTDGLKINSIIAERLDLSFDKREIKTVALRVDSMRIDMDKRFVVSSVINVTPRTITFDGPAELLRDLPTTLYLQIPAKQLRGNFDEEINLNLPFHPLIKVSRQKAFVSFETAEILRP